MNAQKLTAIAGMQLGPLPLQQQGGRARGLQGQGPGNSSTELFRRGQGLFWACWWVVTLDRSWTSSHLCQKGHSRCLLRGVKISVLKHRAGITPAETGKLTHFPTQLSGCSSRWGVPPQASPRCGACPVTGMQKVSICQ